VVVRFKPEAMALEEVFTFKNQRGALTLAQARAASVLAGSLSSVPVFEYAPALVKNVVTGSGRADKKQVAFMVNKLLNITQAHRSDTTDALAIAICHAGQKNTNAMIPGLATRTRASDWRKISVEDLKNLGYKFE
jgi:crossover junction endodeoxyribonuclease RuvC